MMTFKFPLDVKKWIKDQAAEQNRSMTAILLRAVAAQRAKIEQQGTQV